MVNVLDKDKILWYVMRAYKNENTAEDRLSNETYGLEYFIPKQKVLRTVKGKKVFFMVPVIHSLVFVHASHQKIVDFKHNYYYDLQFVTWKSGGELVYLTFGEYCIYAHAASLEQRRSPAKQFTRGWERYSNNPSASFCLKFRMIIRSVSIYISL